MFHDLRRYDVEATRNTRTTLIEYGQAVIDDEWQALAEDQLSPRAGELKRQLAYHVLALEPSTPVQDKLWSRLLIDVDAISSHRLTRLDAALVEPPICLKIVSFGFLVTMACFGAYRPHGPVLALVTLYTVFVGLVLYLILTLSDPFQGSVGVHPDTLKLVIEHLAALEGQM